MIRYKLKIEPTPREILLVNALKDLQDLQARYCDVIQKYEPETDIFKNSGYVDSQEIIKQFYKSVKA